MVGCGKSESGIYRFEVPRGIIRKGRGLLPVESHQECLGAQIFGNSRRDFQERSVAVGHPNGFGAGFTVFKIGKVFSPRVGQGLGGAQQTSPAAKLPKPGQAQDSMTDTKVGGNRGGLGHFPMAGALAVIKSERERHRPALLQSQRQGQTGVESGGKHGYGSLHGRGVAQPPVGNPIFVVLAVEG